MPYGHVPDEDGALTGFSCGMKPPNTADSTGTSATDCVTCPVTKLQCHSFNSRTRQWSHDDYLKIEYATLNEQTDVRNPSECKSFKISKTPLNPGQAEYKNLEVEDLKNMEYSTLNDYFVFNDSKNTLCRY